VIAPYGAADGCLEKITSMRAIGLTEFGGPEVLKAVELPDPEPGPGEVRIRVHAVAVNPTDITFRSGGRAAQLAGRPPPYVPGVDAAGVVDKLGAESDGRLAVGEQVSAFVVPMGPHGGSYAEYIVVPQASVVPAPRGASIWEAATLLLNAATARLALHALALAPGQTVAVVGGAGAVGGYAIQLAKHEGGLTVLASASAADVELVRSLGADLIVEADGDLTAGIRRQLPAGAPGLIDGATLNEAILPAVADGGSLVTLKGWNGPGERNISIHPISSFDFSTDTAVFDRLRQLAEDGTLTLRVAEVTPASKAGEAQRRLAAGGVRGRIVLDFSQPW
jgi:NADPH:quinone reductase-like Zn-dependent oxidoreductase